MTNNNRPQMAAHHWTRLHGWETVAWGYKAKARDVTRDDFPLDDPDGELSDPTIGGAFCWDGEHEGGWMMMLAGQTPAEEAMTAWNAGWGLMRGGIGCAPHRRTDQTRDADYTTLDGAGREWHVFWLHNDSDDGAYHDRAVRARQQASA